MTVESPDEEARLAQGPRARARGDVMLALMAGGYTGQSGEIRALIMPVIYDILTEYIPPAQVAERERRAAERALTEAADAIEFHWFHGNVSKANREQVADALRARAALAAAQPDAEGGDA